MDPKKVKRLQALLEIKEADRSEEEQAEFKALSEEAAKCACQNQPDPDSDEGMTEDDVKKIVSEGIATGLKEIGIEADTISNIQKSLDGKEGLSKDDIQAALKEHIGESANIDIDALKKSIEEAGKSNAGISQEQLDETLKKFGEEFRKETKHAFPDPNESYMPIESRAGNLTVAEKQLLNIMHGSAAAPENGEDDRPKTMNDGIPADVLKRAQERGDRRMKSLRLEASRGKTLTSTGSGTGDELVDADLSNALQVRLYLESQLASMMMSSEVDMPTNPFNLPLLTSRPSFYVGSEAPGSDPTASDPGTADVTFTAAKLIGMTNYSYEVDEDAIIAILPMVQERLGSAAADALEGALINGDTAATHQDSDIHAVSGHHAKLFNGLRKLSLAISALKVDVSTGGISASNIKAVRKALGKYGVKPKDLMLIFGTSGYQDVIGLDETLTMEKVGNNARILTGEAPQIYGIPIVVSSQCREDLNASGVYDGTTTTKGSFLMVHKPSWMLGVRRGFTVEVDVDKKRQINSIVASFRRDFQPQETPAAAVQNVAIAYNYNA